MTKIIYKLMFITLFVVGMSACTTSSKKVTTGYSVEPVSQLDKARAAFSRKDYAFAANLLEPLAKQDEAYAQYALGYMYYNGLGVVRDQNKANQLLNASASNGNKNAIEALRLISPDSSSAPSVTRQTTPQPMAEKNIVNEEMVSMDATPKSANEMSVKEKLMDDPDLLVTDESMVDALMMDEETTPASVDHQKEVAVTEQPAFPEKTSEEASEEVTETPNTLTENEKWIISQPDEYYTIQLLVSGDEAAMQQYIIHNGIQDDVIYYKSKNASADLFILIQGSFESFSEANKIISLMSPAMQKAKPWIRSIIDIKETILVH